MLGYFGEPGATAKTLREGWLYTGDLARQDDAGFFYVTGRKKLVAIFGGENISLTAVEQAALRVSFVSDAAAVCRDYPPFGEVVDLFYTGGGRDPAAETKAIEEALYGMLPSHHALGRVRRLESLPRSESGKLRRYLLGPSTGGPENTAA
jgi:acyl-CoA synthetase (AMP-forming)/AMP-acid ligase II